jgi:hypothetical protein
MQSLKIFRSFVTTSEAPRAPARGICGEAKRNSAEATRLRPYELRRGRLSPFYRA